MQFGWINGIGAGIVLLLMIPNIIYALRNKGELNQCKNTAILVAEQIGRYGCIVWMWLPLLVWKFGFPGVGYMLSYMLGNGVMLLCYLLIFAVYFRKRTACRAYLLAVLPGCIFLLSGLMLRHWLLVGFAVLFLPAHVYVTAVNIKAHLS